MYYTNYTNMKIPKALFLEGFSLNFYNFTLYSEPTASP